MDTPENTAEIVEQPAGEPDALIREAVAEALQGVAMGPEQRGRWGIFDIPPLHLPPGHPALTIIGREEMYDDDGRD